MVAGAVTAATVATGGAVKAATWVPDAERPSMRMGEGTMKVLVIYATKSGCTAGIAEQIGRTLAQRGFSADVVSAEEAGSPSGYDAVVVGSGVRVGAWHAAAKSWMQANAEALRSSPVALYTCGLTITEPSKREEVLAYTDPIIESSGVKPVDVGLFAGWNEPKRFSFLERSIMKLMKAPEGDFRDMAAIAQWTESIAPALAAHA